MFGKNKKEKLQERIEKQKKELLQMEDKKMKLEIKDGSISKVSDNEDKPKEEIKNSPFNNLPNPHLDLLAKQKQQIDEERARLMAQQQQEQYFKAQQQEQMILQQRAQLEKEREMMMQGPQAVQQQMYQPPPQQNVQQQEPSKDNLHVTLFLTEGEIIEKIPVPVNEIELVIKTLDNAIVEQTAFKLGGLTINGLYIKRYLVE